MGDTTVSILPVRPGTISTDDRALLREACVIVIEHENPAELRTLSREFALPSASKVLAAALESLALRPTSSVGEKTSTADVARSTFVQRLAAIAAESANA